ncbi:MAG: autotransporter domain-containing protein [Candidatus Omnitrophota bacterium]|jgi:outer membrane autotransporter protein
MTRKPLLFAAVLFLSFAAQPFSSADSPTYSYSDGILQAISNATTPAGHLAADASIVIIPNTGGTFGLQYDASGNLITRTATYASFYSGNYVDQSGYTIHGNPTTDAAWVTTGNDFTKFYDNKGGGVTNSDLIKVTERGLGMDNSGTHNAIVEFAVAPNNNTIMRPTKNPDITNYATVKGEYGDLLGFVQPPSMTDPQVWLDFQDYYDQFRNASYGADPAKRFPFGQLGYTYFWGNGDKTNLADIQGMSEFIVLGGTSANIHGIYSTVSYIYTKNKNGSFSSDADAQYGNGFASFDVTGPCDTLWAGSRFQKNVSRTSATPNVINVTGAGGVSGGQGILVWSLNYDVTVGTGRTVTTNGDAVTSKKFGLADTASIGILFKGDTALGTPVTSGINKLTNSGTISGPETGVRVDNGNTIIINNAGGTITGTTAAIQLDGGTTAITNNGTISGNLILKANTTAALDVGTGNVALSDGGIYSQGTGTTLKLTANSSSNFGNVTSAGNAVVASGSAVNVTVGGYMPNNTTLKVVDGPGGTNVNVPTTITSNNSKYSFSGASSDGDLILTIIRSGAGNGFAGTTTNGNSSAAGAVLDNISNPAGDMLTVLDTLDALDSTSAGLALATFTPVVDSGVTNVSNTAINQFMGTSTDRLGGLFARAHNEETGESGVSTGSKGESGFEAWGRGFGQAAHQDPRGTSNGYSATIWGTALGGDIPAFNDKVRFGASGGYAASNVNSKDNSGRTYINSYQSTFYGGYIDPEKPYYINGAFSFAYNTYKGKRNIDVGAIRRIANSSYRGQQYSVLFDGGYTFKAKKINITPIASLQYLRLNLQSYNETGAGALDLSVASQGYNMLESGLGMKLDRPFEVSYGTLIPEVHVRWLHDFINDNQATTSTFAGGGGSFATQGFNPARDALNVGGRLALVTKGNWSLDANYDFEYKQDFTSHTGWADIRYKF